ncbi:putative ABC transporter ATP-binding protein YxlF [compost metagenome]
MYENLTARENLKVRTLALGLPESRIAETLTIVDLAHTGKKRAGQFSMGMKQRLGIAIALLNKPKLLILDEPSNGLDPIGIQELRELIRSFPGQGITVILSSHILSEVELVADQIGIIAGGRLGYQGTAPHGAELEALFMQVAGRRAGDSGA